MAKEQISHTDWARVDDDGLTLRIGDLRDAQDIAQVFYDLSVRDHDAGWQDVYAAIDKAIARHRESLVDR